jgi:hypothetical protein
VTLDPSFGPLLRLLTHGRRAVVRITPLTSRDAREMLDAAGLGDDYGLEELLGRLSQMIEELPWLSELTAHVDLGHVAGTATGALGADVRIGFRK